MCEQEGNVKKEQGESLHGRRKQRYVSLRTTSRDEKKSKTKREKVLVPDITDVHIGVLV